MGGHDVLSGAHAAVELTAPPFLFTRVYTHTHTPRNTLRSGGLYRPKHDHTEHTAAELAAPTSTHTHTHLWRPPKKKKPITLSTVAPNGADRPHARLGEARLIGPVRRLEMDLP